MQLESGMPLRALLGSMLVNGSFLLYCSCCARTVYHLPEIAADNEEAP